MKHLLFIIIDNNNIVIFISFNFIIIFYLFLIQFDSKLFIVIIKNTKIKTDTYKQKKKTNGFLIVKKLSHPDNLLDERKLK